MRSVRLQASRGFRNSRTRDSRTWV